MALLLFIPLSSPLPPLPSISSSQVKSNTLRGDEQVHKYALRSLREYLETVRGKRRQAPFYPLSSGSDSTLGGMSEAMEQVYGPRPVRQLSNASETAPPGAAEVKEGSERSEGASSLAVNGSHGPDGRGGVFKAEDGRQGAAVTSTTHNTRTFSEGSGPPVVVHGDAPLKSTTASPVGGLAGGGGVAEEEERYSSASNRSKAQNASARIYNTQMTFEPKLPIPVSSGQERTETMASEGLSLYDDASSSQASSGLLSDTTTPSRMQITMETSSASSLSQETGDRPLSQGNGKKKTRFKQKQLKLEFQELTTENVVKCTLISSTGQVDFRFSTKYDKPGAIFKKLVSFEGGWREGPLA